MAPRASVSPALAVSAAPRSRAPNGIARAGVPLHTLRGNVDYAEAEAHTAYGVCGVKVWVFKGEILGHDPLAQDRLMMEAQTSGVRPAREERGNR